MSEHVSRHNIRATIYDLVSFVFKFFLEVKNLIPKPSKQHNSGVKKKKKKSPDEHIQIKRQKPRKGHTIGQNPTYENKHIQIK